MLQMDDLRLPEEYRRLAERFAAESCEILRDELVGVYLHGSAVMGCFNPRVSDLDLLTVVRGELSAAVRRQYLDMTAALDEIAPAMGIEMSVVPRRACSPFIHPAPFLLHYSRAHTAWYRRDPADYVSKMQGTDPDLAAHFTIVYHRGVCLCGAPVRDVFSEVPKRCYFDSIRCDIENAEAEITENPVYLTLNLCRVLAFAKENLILSKKEGGQWGLAHVPSRFRALIADALRAYESDGELSPEPGSAEDYAAYMLEEIKKEAAL